MINGLALFFIMAGRQRIVIFIQMNVNSFPPTISQKIMTTSENVVKTSCPKDFLMKALSGKWKTCVFRYAVQGPVRFGQMMKLLPDATRQGITNALRELEASGIIERSVVCEKPLHVEYKLTELGLEFVPVFKAIDALNLLPVYKPTVA
jgi:DNA-binding HxlR family transcriptional regulator